MKKKKTIEEDQEFKDINQTEGFDLDKWEGFKLNLQDIKLPEVEIPDFEVEIPKLECEIPDFEFYEGFNMSYDKKTAIKRNKRQKKQQEIKGLSDF